MQQNYYKVKYEYVDEQGKKLLRNIICINQEYTPLKKHQAEAILIEYLCKQSIYVYSLEVTEMKELENLFEVTKEVVTRLCDKFLN